MGKKVRRLERIVSVEPNRTVEKILDTLRQRHEAANRSAEDAAREIVQNMFVSQARDTEFAVTRSLSLAKTEAARWEIEELLKIVRGFLK